MRLTTNTLAFSVSIGLLAGPVSSQDVGPTGPIPYDIVEGWAKPFAGEDFAFGGNSGVYAESPDRIIVLQRGETRLPDPVPAEFNGWAGSLWNVLGGRGRTWQNCIYVLDRDGNFAGRCNMDMVDLEELDDDDADLVRELITRHVDHTTSPCGQRVLEGWTELRASFVKVMPRDYKRVLRAEAKARAESREPGFAELVGTAAY